MKSGTSSLNCSMIIFRVNYACFHYNVGSYTAIIVCLTKLHQLDKQNCWSLDYQEVIQDNKKMVRKKFESRTSGTEFLSRFLLELDRATVSTYDGKTSKSEMGHILIWRGRNNFRLAEITGK